MNQIMILILSTVLETNKTTDISHTHKKKFTKKVNEEYIAEKP